MSLSDGDIQNIRQISDQFAQKLVQRDFVGLANVYTDDATLMPPGPAVTGRSEIKKWMEAFPTVTKFEIEIDDIEGQEDLAYVRGRYFMIMNPEGAPEPVEDRGKYLEIRRRQADGSWLMSVDIFNSDG